MLIEILLFLAIICLAFYAYVTKNFNRYKDLGIPFIKPSFPFGSFNFLSEKHLDIQSLENHRQFPNEKYFGTFIFGKPIVAVNDPDILRIIQVKDFDVFVDRTSYDFNAKCFKGGETDQMWLNQLSSLSGEEWKNVRSTFTPIFTSGKMKTMLRFIQHVSKDLVEEFTKLADNGEEFELKSVFGKFSLDALASSAFGVNADSFKDKNSKFVDHAKRIFHQSNFDQLIWMLRMIPGVPDLFQLFNISTTAPKSTKFFIDIINQSIKMRRQENVRKNDLIDLMLDSIKTQGNLNEEEAENDQFEKDMKLKNSKRKQLDESMIVATAMVLLVAGYDTTGMTLSYLSYELANNPEVQERLQEEIDEAFEDADDQFPDYSVIQSLPYLDMVIHETLRYHPPIGMNWRHAMRDYKLPDSNIFLKKGDGISFNARFLHRLPEHWSHPDEFYPEHFSKEEKANRNPYVFQSFGQGPRACIGMRFALLEAKVAVMAVMKRFSFTPGTKTITPLDIDPNNDLAYPKGGLWVNVESRDNKN